MPIKLFVFFYSCDLVIHKLYKTSNFNSKFRSLCCQQIIIIISFLVNGEKHKNLVYTFSNKYLTGSHFTTLPELSFPWSRFFLYSIYRQNIDQFIGKLLVLLCFRVTHLQLPTLTDAARFLSKAFLSTYT